MTLARALLPIGFSLALAASAPAAAQQRHDSTAPLSFDAQHIELQDKANRVLLSGGVRITQAEMTLVAARVNLSYTGEVSSSPEVHRVDASGGVNITRPDQSATGQYAVYDVDKRIITMVGGVTLKQGPNVVSGGRLVINLDTGRATIDGSGTGGATGTAPGQAGIQSRGGRVTGTFSVPKRKDAPATTPTPAPAAAPAPKQ